MSLVTMKELLDKAQAGRYAVPAFDIMNLDMLGGVMDAAKADNSPVILAYFEGFEGFIDLEYSIKALVEAARRADVPMAVHLDHGSKFEIAARALQAGCTSVMIDASTDTYEENVRKTKEVVRMAHACGATVEAEIGHVGGQEYYDGPEEEIGYTNPAEAARFVADTGIDVLAVSIGSVHGLYRKAPKLNFELLAQITQATSAPLVLHGGSGISDDDFRRLAQNGITKINIFTDLTLAALDAMQTQSERSSATFMGCVGSARRAVAAAASEKIQVFGSHGKA